MKGVVEALEPLLLLDDLQVGTFVFTVLPEEEEEKRKSRRPSVKDPTRLRHRRRLGEARSPVALSLTDTALYRKSPRPWQWGERERDQ